ncbi:TPA: type I-F CRISPR-associated protein Csy3 [Citrobacter freundii]|nr:type I-F CRISPR-associated protein Csy3 [Citrobacter freundii]
MAKSSTTVKKGMVLAFERKLATSDAVMCSGCWEGKNWQPVHIKEKAVRGTISNRLKHPATDDPVKLDADITKANLQRVDVATLPADADTLKVKFTLRVLGNLSTPSVCDDSAYYDALNQMIEGYVDEHGFSELARRYATNLANGRFLWRNRIGAEKIVVKVSGSELWTFDAFDYSLRDFSVSDKKLEALAREIEKGLRGEGFVLLSVEAQILLGAGQEVFPSQELVLDNNSNKSRLLYQVDSVAGMHSQKIGNAIRTIDTWHPRVAEFGVIATEPYGSVTSRGVACRQPADKRDFYTLLNNWVTKKQKPDVEQQHYVMAVLIRGGVFGGKDD